ncbi:mitochondrial glycoprotein [Diaporthe amygdali]|uniref:mitochondrial glycoprotein n=1 Tax=Phomopsis amygdali TaxID=1214568 RepID=UPI0022FF07B2|nr:mitochondrial glycoprotein [Diaporthe amygdali]KAJ0115964.1 mitochondrial glycoprotein [Diaporthe amygdali]
MFPARSLARAAPRTAARLSSVARPATAIHSALLRNQYRTSRSQVSAFSTSLFRRAASGADSELSAKLNSEIQFETEMKENEPQPVSIKDFLDNSPFEIQDTPGVQNVVLTRTYNNEKITVTFSIADIANMENEMFDEDSALGDEEARSQENPEDMDEAESGNEPNVTCRLNIVVEKPGKGALNIEAIAQDASIIVENMYYYNDPAIAHSASPEAEHKSRDIYPGPPFGTLDEDLQLLMEGFLDERGINSTLAVFVPDYMDVKEQREYLAWLNNVKGFVDA